MFMIRSMLHERRGRVDYIDATRVKYIFLFYGYYPTVIRPLAESSTFAGSTMGRSRYDGRLTIDPVRWHGNGVFETCPIIRRFCSPVRPCGSSAAFIG